MQDQTTQLFFVQEFIFSHLLIHLLNDISFYRNQFILYNFDHLFIYSFAYIIIY